MFQTLRIQDKPYMTAMVGMVYLTFFISSIIDTNSLFCFLKLKRQSHNVDNGLPNFFSISARYFFIGRPFIPITSHSELSILDHTLHFLVHYYYFDTPLLSQQLGLIWTKMKA